MQKPKEEKDIETSIYKDLSNLTRDKDSWKTHIPYVASQLSNPSEHIRAKTLWLLGEMGLLYPLIVQDHVAKIASFLDSETPLLRQRALNGLGRIGRGDFRVIEEYWEDLFRFAKDEDAGVRLNFIWASENIATNTPDIYKYHMDVFAGLLSDTDEKVRMEAPETSASSENEDRNSSVPI
ncbi:MAG: HEAT repeat domain-containing protein [Clostridiales bacterium]|nr:HEAT repeat domain-containing protein [Clostridiales bacterium]